MSLLALTPNQLPGGGAVLNVTTGDTAVGSNTGCTFSNDGQVFLVVINGVTAGTATVKIASTIEGQGVTSISGLTIAASDTTIIGPFDEAFSNGFGGTAEVDFGTPTTMAVMLCHYKATS